MSIIATLYWFDNLDSQAKTTAVNNYKKEFKYEKNTNEQIEKILAINNYMFYADGKKYRM